MSEQVNLQYIWCKMLAMSARTQIVVATQYTYVAEFRYRND